MHSSSRHQQSGLIVHLCCCDKHPDRKPSEERGTYFNSQSRLIVHYFVEVKGRNSSSLSYYSHSQGQRENKTSFLARLRNLVLRNPCPRKCATRNGLGLPLSINNQFPSHACKSIWCRQPFTKTPFSSHTAFNPRAQVSLLETNLVHIGSSGHQGLHRGLCLKTTRKPKQ